MKYLKTFESIDKTSLLRKQYGDQLIDEYESVASEIKDIMIELEDLGYSIHFQYDSDTHIYKPKTPIILITISKYTERLGIGPMFEPLYTTDDEKIEFDDVILRIWHYAVIQGFSYTGEEIKNLAKTYIIKFQIRLKKK